MTKKNVFRSVLNADFNKPLPSFSSAFGSKGLVQFAPSFQSGSEYLSLWPLNNCFLRFIELILVRAR